MFKSNKSHVIRLFISGLLVLCLFLNLCVVCVAAQAKIDSRSVNFSKTDKEITFSVECACKLYALFSGEFLDSLITRDNTSEPDFLNDPVLSRIFEPDGKQYFFQPTEIHNPDRFLLTKESIGSFEELQKIYNEYFVSIDVKKEAGEGGKYYSKYFFDKNGRLYLGSGFPFWGFDGYEFYDYENMRIEYTDSSHAVVLIEHVNLTYPEYSQWYSYAMILDNGHWKLNGKPATVHPPKSGENTGVYLFLTVVSLLTLTFIPAAHNRKKRTVRACGQ